MSGELERRYRQVLRLLPGYYRAQWEQDMIGARLAVRLYLGGAGAPRRYFAWGQAVRRAVLAVLLVHAVLAVDILVFLERGRRLVGWLPPPPASLVIAPGGGWDMAYYLVSIAWIAIFVTLALGYYRTARVLAALAIAPALAAGPARRLPPGVRAAAGAPGDRQLCLAARLSGAVLHPGQPGLPRT